MSKTWILPIAGLLALVIAAVALVARFTSHSLEPPVSEAPAPLAPPAAADAPTPAAQSTPPPIAAQAPPPPRVEVKLADLDSFKTLTASPFPVKAEWGAFVSKADAVAREQMEKSGVFSEPIDLTPFKEMEKQGIPATAAMRATLEARKKKALEDYEAFTKNVDGVYQSWGDKTPEVPKEATAAMATDLVNHRSRLLFLDDRLSRLQ